MKNQNNTGIPKGGIAFYDNSTPALEAGIYDINVKSDVEGIDTKGYFTTPITQRFEVRGPQFSLPAGEVHAVYPPHNSNAIYGEVLPHVVLNKRVLPWERYLEVSDPRIPWLCLLVFKEGEISINKETNSSLIKSTVRDFLAIEQDVLKPDIDSKSLSPDVLGSYCQSIKISADSFKALTPGKDDLKYLSHVRQVDTGNQEITGVENRGWFSVVVGNRFLTGEKSGTRYYIHLVSLEGFSKYLSGASIKYKDVQLISLYNWSVVSHPQEGESFADLVENFVHQAEGGPDNLLLRLQPKNTGSIPQQVLERLQNGYLPVSYQAPSGEETFAWYRGPFTPVIAQPLPRPSADYHYPSVSSAMIYDKNAGVFDQSYAAAWSLGRALALADGSFGQLLLQYRRKSYQVLGKLVDHLGDCKDASAADLCEAIRGSVVRKKFDKLLAADLGTSLTKTFNNIIRGVTDTGTPGKTGAAHINLVAVTQQCLAAPNVQTLLEKELDPDVDPISEWLARKQLLYDVPFNHLAPNQEMLPVESLRFFYVDQNWLDVLVDGALSIGVQSFKDASLNQVMKGVINNAVTKKTKALRKKLLGTPVEDSEADSKKETMSGLLIRSAVVSGWPGLVIKGYKKKKELKIIRMDRLSSNVLLCLFLDIPDTITISEPQQGLRFGVEDNKEITLRSLSDPVGKPLAGKTFPFKKECFRSTVNGVGGSVLNINGGSTGVIQTMQQTQYLGQPIGPADFAIQMVNAPEQLSFKPTS